MGRLIPDDQILFAGGADGRKTRPLIIDEALYPCGFAGNGKTRDYTFVGYDELRFFNMFDQMPPPMVSLDDTRLFKTIVQGESNA